ncbi:hypothetical protein RQP46_007382 [Phenoliferia psychrophenolica]
MILSSLLLLLSLSLAQALPAAQQHVLAPDRPGFNAAPISHDEEGVGYLSKWARETKVQFLKDLSKNQAEHWTLVFGNEGGDLDSMVSALAWSYHLSHLPHPKKAIALLQTEADALDLRPDNALALHYARMASKHRDILTIDELPIKPFDMWHRVKGVHLVDHNVPRTMWGNITILGILDHHLDQHLAKHASPRIIHPSASCSSLVTAAIFAAHSSLNLDESLDPFLALPEVDEDDDDDESPLSASFKRRPVPLELMELLLRTISLDSGGLKAKNSFPVDIKAAKLLLHKSSWRGRKLHEVTKMLKTDMKAAKNSLGELTLRDLLRRDWKGDLVPTKSTKYPTLSLGFASMPISLHDQILLLPEQTPPEWFAVERAWTAESGTDVSCVLTNYRDPISDRKVHEIAIVVAHGWSKRLHERAADRLFEALKKGIEDAPELDVLEKWERPDGKPLLPRRMVWRHFSDDAGRKLLRPIVERVASKWKG